MRGIDLSGLDLWGCHARADFSYGTLDRADLRDADLICCGFSHASLRNVRAKGALLSGVTAKFAMFDEAELPETTFTLSILQGASFRGANLSGAMIDLVRIDGADFRGALLRDARFDRSGVASALATAALESATAPRR